MPIDAAIVAAGIAAASGAGQAWATSKGNKKSRNFTREMYARQRQDNLADWHAVNQYNDPKAQMQRFKDAGLNPHLIYGQQQTAEQVQKAQGMGYNHQVPDIGGIGSAGMQAYYSAQQHKTSMDQNAQALQNAKATERQINANILKTYQEAKKIGFENKQTEEIWDENIKAVKLRTDNLQADYDLKLQEKELNENEDKRQTAKLELEAKKFSLDKWESEGKMKISEAQLGLQKAKNERERKTTEAVLKRMDEDLEYRKILRQQLEEGGEETLINSLQDLGLTRKNANIIAKFLQLLFNQ